MTFSIVARCERTGQLGVALATGLPAGGAHCVYAAGGVGAIATQAYTNPYMGLDVLRRLGDGVSAEAALVASLGEDPDPSRRQVVVVDASGRAAGHTGAAAFRWRGHRCRNNVAVAANMVPSERLTDAMWTEFQRNRSEALWWRLAKVLVAGEAADREALRPCRSAVVRVVSTEQYPLLEVRVDVSTNPIGELLDAVAEVEDTCLLFNRMLPTRSEPAGRFDLDALDARGLMPDASATSET